MLVLWHENRYEINYSQFFRGGWRVVLKWCNQWAHKRTISISTIDFRPTLTFQSTSDDLRQQRLTSFCAVYGVLFDYKRESTVVSSGVLVTTTKNPQSAECLYAIFCNQTSIFKVKVTVWAHIIKTWFIYFFTISFISSKPVSLLQPNSVWW